MIKQVNSVNMMNATHTEAVTVLKNVKEVCRMVVSREVLVVMPEEQLEKTEGKDLYRGRVGEAYYKCRIMKKHKTCFCVAFGYCRVSMIDTWHTIMQTMSMIIVLGIRFCYILPTKLSDQ